MPTGLEMRISTGEVLVEGTVVVVEGIIDIQVKERPGQSISPFAEPNVINMRLLLAHCKRRVCLIKLFVF